MWGRPSGRLPRPPSTPHRFTTNRRTRLALLQTLTAYKIGTWYTFLNSLTFHRVDTQSSVIWKRLERNINSSLWRCFCDTIPKAIAASNLAGSLLTWLALGLIGKSKNGRIRGYNPCERFWWQC